jgi:hypothetical protein
MVASVETNFNQEVRETMKGFPGDNDGQKFARAVLEFAYGLPHDEAINANSCDGSLDRGLDACFSDSDYLYLMQFKYHDDPAGKTIQFSATGPGHQLVHCWPYVSTLNLASSELAQKRIRQELYDVSVRFQDEVDVHSKSVKLVVVEWADGPVGDAEHSAKVWLDSLPIGHHIESFNIENFQSIRALWEQRKAPVTRYQGTIDLPFLGDEGKIQLSTPHEAIVLHVPGKELADLFRKAKDVLFDPNVRFELTKSRFNPDIKVTATKDPGSFWYYNNGITIICSDFKLEPDRLVMTNPGVVNGGQTIKQLSQVGNVSKDLKVLVRVIRSTDPVFDGKIALYTNSQNAITLRDLVSNGQEQIVYQTEFGQIPFPWFYERKRGSWDILNLHERQKFYAAGSGKGRKRERRISNELVGKAILSFSVQQPVVAKTDTPAIWTLPPNGYYQEIFNKNRDVYELAVATLVYQILDIQRTALAARTGLGGLGSKEEIKDCIPHLTGLVGRIIREKYQKGLTREDFQRMYKDLIDPQTQFTSTNNFVMSLFSSALFPFVAWYNSSRRGADPRWESSNWYKQAGSWNIVRDVASMVPAFELYRSFTPAADSKSTSALIP